MTRRLRLPSPVRSSTRYARSAVDLTKRTYIECTQFPGRSLEAKKRLYRLLVDRLEALGTPRRDVVIVLHEPPIENWGVHGGRPASEVDLGYSLNV